MLPINNVCWQSCLDPGAPRLSARDEVRGGIIVLAMYRHWAQWRFSVVQDITAFSSSPFVDLELATRGAS